MTRRQHVVSLRRPRNEICGHDEQSYTRKNEAAPQSLESFSFQNNTSFRGKISQHVRTIPSSPTHRVQHQISHGAMDYTTPVDGTLTYIRFGKYFTRNKKTLLETT